MREAKDVSTRNGCHNGVDAESSAKKLVGLRLSEYASHHEAVHLIDDRAEQAACCHRITTAQTTDG